MDSADNPRPLTVSQVLGAHAAAQMARAQASDDAKAAPVEAGERDIDSFTVTWATQAMCIGWTSLA